MKKRILKVLGMAPIVVLPLATTISLTEYRIPSKKEFQDFIQNIYFDDSPIILTKDEKIVMKNSKVYKSNVDLNKIGLGQLQPLIMEVFTSSIPLNAKKILAKKIIKSDAYNNFLLRVGAPEKDVSNKDLVISNKWLSEPTFAKSKNHILGIPIIGAKTKINGVTGNGIEWKKYSEDASVYTISNQDQYNMLVSSIFKGLAFQNIVEYIKNNTDNFFMGHLSFKDFMNELSVKYKSFLKDLSISIEDETKMNQYGIFKTFATLFKISNKQAYTTSEEAFKELINSELGSYLYGDVGQSKLSDFTNHKNKRKYILSDLSSSLENIFSDLFKYDDIFRKNIKQNKINVSRDERLYLRNLSLTMIKETNLQSFFQIKSFFNFIKGGNLSFRTNLENNFKQLNKNIKLITKKVGPSIFDGENIFQDRNREKYSHGNLAQALIPHKEINISVKGILKENNKQGFVSSKLENFILMLDFSKNGINIPTTGKVNIVTSMEKDKTKIRNITRHLKTVSGGGHWETVWVQEPGGYPVKGHQENRWVSDSDKVIVTETKDKFEVKFKKFNIIKKKSDFDKMGDFKLKVQFKNNLQNKQEIQFNSLKDILKKNIMIVVNDEINKWKLEHKNDKTLPLYNYIFEVKINSIDFGDIRFENFIKDKKIHINNLNFTNVKVNIGYRIFKTLL